MKKLVKLPLFLGLCGAGCAGILAGVNAITSPIIKANSLAKANKAIKVAFESYNISDEDIFRGQEISDELKKVGVSEKIKVTNNDNLTDGMVYVCSASGGYGGSIEFQVAFAEGKIVGYTDIKNNETGTLGGRLISMLSEALTGKDATRDPIDISIGATVTKTAINNAINAIVEDYNGK